MDQESVKQAFNISNNGEVSLNWENGYTLNVDISKLENEQTYKITIDGAIAKTNRPANSSMVTATEKKVEITNWNSPLNHLTRPLRKLFLSTRLLTENRSAHTALLSVLNSAKKLFGTKTTQTT